MLVMKPSMSSALSTSTSTSPVSSKSGHWVCGIRSAKLSCDRSILDCDLPEFEDPSDEERGRVSPPELEVQVLEHERVVGAGLVKTGTAV